MDRQTDRHTCRQIDKDTQTDRQTYRHTGGQINRDTQTDRQTETHRRTDRQRHKDGQIDKDTCTNGQTRIDLLTVDEDDMKVTVYVNSCDPLFKWDILDTS